MLHPETPGAAGLHEALVQGDGQIGLGGPGKARAAGGGVGVQGELGHHQKGAPHLFQIQVHLAVLVLKHPEIADFLRQLVGHGLGVAGAHPQQDQISLFNGPHRVSVNSDGGGGNSCNYCAHCFTTF